MIQSRYFAIAVLLTCLVDPSGLWAQTKPEPQEVEIGLEQRGKHEFVVIKNLTPAIELQIEIRLGSSDQESPPIMGKTVIQEPRLVFQPRFPLIAGEYEVSVLRAGSVIHRGQFRLAGEENPAAKVKAIYPSSDVIPENTLKFYVHFTGPMRKGDIYQFVRLREVNGDEIELPFLEIEQEFWSRNARRLTLLLDPGRIKRGLKPREEMGPIFESGQSYELVIDGTWPDANGHPLGADVVKTFQAGAEDHSQPDPSRWKIEAPMRDVQDELLIVFPDSLDHAMLFSAMRIENAAGEPVEGEISISDHETRWRFKPATPWRPGKYRVSVNSNLEDNAGNSIGRLFDVDLFEKTEALQADPMVEIEFTIAD